MADRVIRIILTGSSAGAVAAMAETGAAAEKTTSKIDTLTRAGGGMKSLGHSMTALAVPFLAVGGYAVKTAADFQTSMTQIRTQVGVGAGEMNRMSSAIQTLAPKVGEGPNALAQALYPIESVGLRGTQALLALKAASMGAQVSGASLTDTADALSGALRVQLKDVHSASDAMSIMNGIVAQGKMHLTDLTAAFSSQILTAAKGAGLGFRDVGDALAAMTRQGIPASVEATRLRLTLGQMEAPTSTALKALAAIRLNQFSLADDLRKPNGLITALLDLRSHLSGLTKDQQNLVLSEAFGHAKGSQNVVGLLNALPQMQTIQRPLAAAGDAQLMAAFGLRQKDISFQWEQLKATAETALIGIGQAIMPIVKQLLPAFANAIKAVAHWFAGLPKPVREFLIGMTLVLGIGGPILIFLGYLATAIGVIAGAFAALDLAVAPELLIAAAFIAIGVAIYLAWGYIKKFFALVISGVEIARSAITSAFGAAVGFVGGIFQSLAHTIVSNFNDVVSFFASLPGAIGSAFSTVGNIIASIFGSAVNVIIDGINIVIKALDWLIRRYNDVVGSIPFVGGDLTVGQIGTIGHVNLGSSPPAPRTRTSSQSVGSQPGNSVNQSGHSTTPPAPIVLHHTTRLGNRVVAEETVHYAAKRTSLGGAVH